jgi:manganese oxidase
MLMGERGMADMGQTEMPLPDNTLPMMSGSGPFGAMEMGGMFTVVKVRQGLARNDYKDPGWYQHPAGTLAYEWKGDPPAASRKPQAVQEGPVLKARKPGAGSHEH